MSVWPVKLKGFDIDLSDVDQHLQIDMAMTEDSTRQPHVLGAKRFLHMLVVNGIAPITPELAKDQSVLVSIFV